MKIPFLTLVISTFSTGLFAQFGAEQIVLEDRDIGDITFGDIDNDGDTDLLVFSSPGPGKLLGWYENMGNTGDFSGYRSLQTNFTGFAYTKVADLNGDGLNDILIRADKLYWKPGLGMGQFSAEITIPTSSVSLQGLFLPIDWDADGDPDILYHVGNKILWLENDGNGNFNNEYILTDNISATDYLQFGDVDMDGDLDLFRATAKTLYWYEYDAGGFSNPQLIQDFFNQIRSIAVADFDDDGDADIAMLGLASDDLIWFENEDGAGTFGESQLIEDIPNNGSLLFAIDFDQDGDQDLVATQIFLNKLKYYENTGTSGLFASPQLICESIDLPNRVFLGDLTGDGLPEVVSVPNQDYYLQWFRNILPSTNNWPSSYMYRRINHMHHVALSDLDGDGDQDILIGADHAAWCENVDGKESFSAPKILILDGTTNDAVNIFALDFDGDGDQDVITVWDVGGLKWLENLDGAGNFGPPAVFYSGSSDNVCLADADGDGDQDIVLTRSPIDLVAWLENANGGFATSHLISNANATYRGIQCLDFDIDGDNDVIVGLQGQTNDIAIFENEGAGVFNATPNTILSDLGFNPVFAAGDLDNDGLPDIVVSSIGNFVWYKNLDGNGSFEGPKLIDPAVNSATSIHIEDLDGNGFRDILITRQDDEEVVVFLNLGGFFQPKNKINKQISEAFFFATSGDVNSDGSPDILAIAIFNSKIMWYPNLDNSLKAQGITFWDENENGILEPGEPGLFGQQVHIQPDALGAWSNQAGHYGFALAPGNYQLTCSPQSIWELTTPATFDVILTDSSLVYHFGLTAASPVSRGETSLSSAPTRCGFQVPFWLDYRNTGTLPAQGSVSIELDGLTELLSADPLPDQVDGNLLRWEFDNLIPTYGNQIYLLLQMPDVNSLGATIQFHSTIGLADENGNAVFTGNNSYSSVINCAYDPNDKLVEPSYHGHENYALLDEALTYTIRFQNTGTDTAFNVRLEDFLDPNLDLSTLEVVAASHPYEVFLTDAGRLTFYFNNILLPDSTTNEPASHGFVKYRIRPLQGLPEPSLIQNEALIFFDFNPAIVTNVVTNILVSEFPVTALVADPLCHDSEDGQIALSFPTGPFTYQWSNGATASSLESLASGEYMVTVFNAAGKVVADTSFTLTAPPELTLSLSSTPEENGQGNGTASATASGGVPPYAFSWNTTPPQNTQIAGGLTGGAWSVTLTDANGCVQTGTVVVDMVISAREPATPSWFAISPNPSSGEVWVEILPSAPLTWKLKIFDENGRLLKTYPQGGLASGAERIGIHDLAQGVYFFSFEAGEKKWVEKVVRH